MRPGSRHCPASRFTSQPWKVTFLSHPAAQSKPWDVAQVSAPRFLFPGCQDKCPCLENGERTGSLKEEVGTLEAVDEPWRLWHRRGLVPSTERGRGQISEVTWVQEGGFVGGGGGNMCVTGDAAQPDLTVVVSGLAFHTCGFIEHGSLPPSCFLCF